MGKKCRGNRKGKREQREALQRNEETKKCQKLKRQGDRDRVSESKETEKR